MVFYGNNSTVDIMDNINIKEPRFAIFPNPANKVVHVRSENNQQIVQNIKILDIRGDLKAYSVDSTIDISRLTLGIYFLEIETIENKKSFYKLIKY